MMKLGFMTYSLSRSLADGTLSMPAALALMKELGAEGVDFSAPHGTDYTNADVREMVQDAGLVISSYIGGANLTMDDPAERAHSLDEIRRVIDSAVEAGTTAVMVTTGNCARGQDRAEGRRNVAAGLAEVLPYAKDRGVTLSTEELGSSLAPYQTSAECLEVLEMAGADLMMTYDSGNMVLGDEDPISFLEAVKSRVVHAHVKDWELLPPETDIGLTARSGKKYVGTAVGQGILDYPAIITALKAMDYQGFLSFEYEGRTDPVQAAREGMAYLRDLL